MHHVAQIDSTPTPALPKLPTTTFPLSLVRPTSNDQVIDPSSNKHKAYHSQARQGLSEYTAAEKKQADATKDNGRCKPASIWPLQIWFFDPQNK